MDAGISVEDFGALATLADSEDIKNQLKDTTEEAAKRGCFGAPTIFGKNKDGKEMMVFGGDRIEHLMFFMGYLAEPLDILVLSKL